ncbi:Rne/Rng family ribonuclease [Thalassobius sp. MITS945101]|uniref:Rne/Rng family ribonuclease n=1 Tax=Thalassobius sp. MITS945101 TaxID=3096994 RepID=UPI00399B2E71
MAKKMLIDATHAEETRVVVVDGNKVEEFDFESENKRQLAGNIYLAKVTRVEPSLQAAFVDYGGNRHGFLAFSEIHPDYYQIPVADREALMEEERAYAEQQKAEEEEEEKKPRRRRSRSRAASNRSKDAKVSKEVTKPAEETSAEAAEAPAGEIAGMETIDLTDGENAEATEAVEVGAAGEGLSPMETVAETPVEEPAEATAEDAPAEDTVAEAPEAAEAVKADDVVAEADVAEPETAQAEDAAAEDTPAEEAAEAAPETAAAAEVTADDAVAEAPVEETVAEDAPAEEAAAEEAQAEEVQAEDNADADAPAEANAEEASEEAAAESSDDDEDDSGDEKLDATDKDDSIESVAEEDDSEEIRPRRKPRPRRYKIQEVIKVRQILLVQVVKEERGNKGAALTTYLSLAGRYCVLMPNTARGGGISRKITNAADRKKLKEIANELDVPKGAGLIVRTAGAKRTKAEIKRDYEYLQRMWEQIRELTLKSIAPAKIYEEGDLIKRSIRDLYNREIDEVLVEGERGYRIAKDFMKMIMPSHAKNVKNYHDQMPLFARYQVESYLSGMFNPTVQLKSGGYIVIGVTEALVAVDVNSGRATKEGSIEETALKTNLEAAEEVARQLRLRDLAGLIVIDFIDMDERRNNNAVEKRLKDKLKSDRARIQIGRISGFGLLEMSRQRLRPGMIEATTQPCPHCHGTGLIRSDDNLALSILRQIEEEGTRGRSREVLVKCPVGIANFIMNQKREHVAQIEARYGLSVRIEGDPMLVSPDFTLEKFKTATRVVAEAPAPVVSVDTSLMDQIDEEAEAEEAEAAEAADVEAPEVAAGAEDGEDQKPKRRRRRRRRRKSGADRAEGENGENGEGDNAAEGDAVAEGGAEGKTADTSEEASEVKSEETSEDAGEEKKPRRRRRSRRKKSDQPAEEVAEATEASAEGAEAEATVSVDAADTAEAVSEEVPAEDEAVSEDAAPEATAEVTAEETVAEDVAAEEAVAEPAEDVVEATAEKVAEEPAPEAAEAEAPELVTAAAEPVAEPVAEVVAEPAPEPVTEPVAEEPAAPPKPKRRGWWSS